MSALTPDQAERYQRQELLPEFKGRTPLLQGKSVGVVGLGGLGALCAYLLAGAGVGELRLADGDSAALSNLHRQVLYDLTAVGKSKAQCAAARIRALDPDLKLKVFNERITKENFAEFADGLTLLLLLTDNQSSRIELSDLACRAGLNTVIACVAGFAGLLAAYFYADKDFVRQYGCYRCLCQGSLSPSGQVIEPPVQGILGPAAAQMASAAAMSALQILGEIYPAELKGRLSIYNLNTQSVRRVKLKRSRSCTGCTEYAD